MNVIFVMADSFRYDNLSCYAATPVKTPHLDRFAQQAIVFDNAYIGSFPTVPNRLDTMSGLFSFINYQWQPLPREIITLPQLLSASGFITQMIVDTPHLIGEGFNYCRDFDGWEWVRGQETDRWMTAPREVKLPAAVHKLRTPEIIKRHYRNSAWWQGEEDHFVARTMQTACRWLEQNQDQEKFFLWVDTFDPHEPWDPPQNYLELYEKGYTGEEPNYPQYCFWRDVMSEAELNHNRALYMGEVSLVDRWVGVLLDKIDELGMAEDTAVIFVSDHGFLFGEHGHIGKSYIRELNGRMFYEAIPMYDDIRRIPLMIRIPGERGGRRIPALVQTPDLMPTILELAGLVSTETVGGQSRTQALQCGVFDTQDWQFKPEAIHGKSLMPLIRGETARNRDLVICSNTLIHHSPLLAKCAVVTEDGWCLHHAGVYAAERGAGGLAGVRLIDSAAAKIPTAPALYNLAADPDEEQDVLAANEGLAHDIHQRYVKFLEEIGAPEQHLTGRRKLLRTGSCWLVTGAGPVQQRLQPPPVSPTGRYACRS